MNLRLISIEKINIFNPNFEIHLDSPELPAVVYAIS